MTKRVVWFSRHEPTPAQLSEMTRVGDGAPVVHMTEEASRPILTLADARETLDGLARSGATHIFGVFPPILQAGITADRADEMTCENMCGGVAGTRWLRAVPVFAAWNVNRAPEGDRPTFQHEGFVRVGSLLEPAAGVEHYRL